MSPHLLRWAAIIKGALRPHGANSRANSKQPFTRMASFDFKMPIHAPGECLRACPSMSIPLEIVHSHGAILTPCNKLTWFTGPS